MGKPITIGQSHNLMSVLANNVCWDELDAKKVQEVIDKPQEAGRQFTQFLKNGAEAVICLLASFVTKLVDKFSHTEFLGEDWKIAERDEREDGLTEVDWFKVDFETCLKPNESHITGEEKLKRLKAGGKVRLGGRAFLTLWQDYQEKKEASVLEQLYKTKGILYVDFFGLILQTPSGGRRVLYLCRGGDGAWFWHFDWLGRGWLARSFSAVSQVSSN